jgi:hypothetical protein
MFRSPVRRQQDGSFTVALSAQERELLGSLLSQLRTLVTTDGPGVARLFPTPYGDDEERNAGYAALAGPELVERRLAAIDVVERTLTEERVSEDDLEAWMRSINDVRLVLGTILEVSDDGDPPEVTEANAATFAAYEYLGALLEVIVAALAD